MNCFCYFYCANIILQKRWFEWLSQSGYKKNIYFWNINYIIIIIFKMYLKFVKSGVIEEKLYLFHLIFFKKKY